MNTPSSPAPLVVAEPRLMRDTILAARRAGRRVGFVPTMGALHAGHASLVERAAVECDDVVVSIFVNPKQFGPREDLARYPRTLPADVALLGASGARWVFVPEASTAYPAGHATSVVVAAPAADFEGAIRPGHFAGVATVVCWLFNVVPADVAYFGAKDWQQTVVVRRMVADLAIPIAIEVCPTSNVQTGAAPSIERHPVRSLLERGATVVVCTDNRLVSDVTLSHELRAVASAAQLGLDEIGLLLRRGFSSAFVSLDERRRLLADFDAAFASLRAGS